MENKKVEFLVVDTTSFIQNAPLQDIAENIITCKEVVDEITSKRQLRRLAVLPYDLIIKDVFPENIKVVTDFAKKTGDYISLSATDIKVMALTYQLEKEKVGIDHIRTSPIMQKCVNLVNKPTVVKVNEDLAGFYSGKGSLKHDKHEDQNEEFFDTSQETDVQGPEDESTYETCSNGEQCDEHIEDSKDDISDNKESEEGECENKESEEENEHKSNSEEENEHESNSEEGSCCECEEDNDDEDGGGWITPSNVKKVKNEMKSTDMMEEKHVTVGCMTTDFAMQNVLKQMNLNVCALDGRIIKQLRTFILRCYSCFKTTSIMTKRFCPSCGNDTLKKVAVSLDVNGKLQIHINARKPLTGRGKKFSIPTFKGGKHPNNPIVCEDQRIPHNRQSKLARIKINPLDHDYIPGYSPFVTRDVNSRSALLGVKTQEFKHWMKKNPNEARRRRK